MNEERKFKRGLGEGRWDRKLKQEMVRLSVADNYEEAKYEWTATGEIWWNMGNVYAVIKSYITLRFLMKKPSLENVSVATTLTPILFSMKSRTEQA